jgi:hypothetical protein
MSRLLKKKIEENSFIVNEPIDNLFVIEDFISSEEIKTLMDIINNTKEEDWLVEYTSNLKKFCMEKFGRDDVENLVSEGKFEVTKGWQDKNLIISDHNLANRIILRLRYVVDSAHPELQVTGLKTFQRMQEGVELVPHIDEYTDPSIVYATILYLNDDYLGGELFFSNKDFKIKPKPGSLLIFPGTDEFKHGVSPVQVGPIRYVVVGFVKIKDFYKNNKY